MPLVPERDSFTKIFRELDRRLRALETRLTGTGYSQVLQSGDVSTTSETYESLPGGPIISNLKLGVKGAVRIDAVALISTPAADVIGATALFVDGEVSSPLLTFGSSAGAAQASVSTMVVVEGLGAYANIDTLEMQYYVAGSGEVIFSERALLATPL